VRFEVLTVMKPWWWRQCSSKTLISTYKSTWHYYPEDQNRVLIVLSEVIWRNALLHEMHMYFIYLSYNLCFLYSSRSKYLQVSWGLSHDTSSHSPKFVWSDCWKLKNKVLLASKFITLWNMGFRVCFWTWKLQGKKNICILLGLYIKLYNYIASMCKCV
jgi:hypothetical protein